jgi:NAD(P)-dependent dehydrogenase (short-subunit alcohol dehydrogenase family)
MNRTVVITGANSGIGKSAALRFATEGWAVVMACRSPERAAAARAEIIRESGSDRVTLMPVDMSSQDSIRRFADAFRQSRSRLDVLIHNAAYFNHGEAYRLGPDGTEITFATNVAGPFLLTRLLLDGLRESDDPRILHAGSNIVNHYFDPRKQLDFSALHGVPSGHKEPAVYERYRQSKMALLMLTLVMARELESDGIAVNCLQINGARMSQETIARFTWRYRVVARVQNLFFPPTERLADAYFQITTADRFRGVTGQNINAKLELMVAASNEGVGVREQIRNVTGTGTYPVYAQDRAMQEAVRGLCESLTEAAMAS